MSAYEWSRFRDRDEVVVIGKRLAAEVKSDDVPSLAAAVAFKIVLALVPGLLAAIAITGLIVERGAVLELIDRVDEVLPSEATEFLVDQVVDPLTDTTAAGLALVISIAIGLNSATSAAVTLNRALTRANDLVDRRKLVSARLTALVVTLALLLALIVMLVVLIVGGQVEDTILRTLGLGGVALSVADFASTVGRYAGSLVVLMLLFAFIYWYGPDFERRPPYPWISPGAALGVVVWLVGSGLFSVYVDNFGNFGEGSVYGSLGSAIVFMLWLQLSMLALLLGAELNQVLRVRQRQASDAAQIAGFGGEPAAAVAPPVDEASPITPTATPASRSVAGGPDDGDGNGHGSRGRTSDDGAGSRGRTSGGGVGSTSERDGGGWRAPVRARVGVVAAAVAAVLGAVGLLRGRRDS